jgi:hypothetical protein
MFLSLPLIALAGLLAINAAGGEETGGPPMKTHRTDWFKEAGWGVFTHYLTGSETTAQDWNRRVDAFDVPGLARQLEVMGCRYYVITLGQNSGHFCSPNAAYDRYAGLQPSKCSRRDLVADLVTALKPRGIRLMLYLPCQTPNRDGRAQRGFGLPQGPRDQPIDETFAEKWAEVIHELSTRYGKDVAGWWFDGGYQHVRFNDAIARIYADAVKRGNPDAIVAFNPGVVLKRWVEAEDYTAGEINEPLMVECAGRWVGASQWHMLSYLGPQWGAGPPRFSNEAVIEVTRNILESEGVVTWDVPIQASGLIPEPFVKQLAALKAALAQPPASAVRRIPVPPGNLAYRKRARLLDVTGTKALDVNSGKHFARNGVDGDATTKAHAGGEWPWTFHVDLGAVHPLQRVLITFDKDCYATEYKVNLSADGRTWTTVAHEKDATGGKPEHSFEPTPARYVRIQALKPDGPNQKGRQMGVVELEVYGREGG